MVIDSTDRERLGVIKEELFKMLAHEVVQLALAPVCLFCARRAAAACRMHPFRSASQRFGPPPPPPPPPSPPPPKRTCNPPACSSLQTSKICR